MSDWISFYIKLLFIRGRFINLVLRVFLYHLLFRSHIPFCFYFSHCTKNVQIRRFFWYVFSRIGTEYGDLRRILRIQSKYQEIRTRKSVFGHFLFQFSSIQQVNPFQATGLFLKPLKALKN